MTVVTNLIQIRTQRHSFHVRTTAHTWTTAGTSNRSTQTIRYSWHLVLA